MSALQKLAKMLGVGEHQAEDAMHSERAAKAALSRRNLFAAAGALAAGTVFVPVRQVTPAWQSLRVFIKGLEFEVVDEPFPCDHFSGSFPSQIFQLGSASVELTLGEAL